MQDKISDYFSGRKSVLGALVLIVLFFAAMYGLPYLRPAWNFINSSDSSLLVLGFLGVMLFIGFQVQKNSREEETWRPEWMPKRYMQKVFNVATSEDPVDTEEKKTKAKAKYLQKFLSYSHSPEHLNSNSFFFGFNAKGHPVTTSMEHMSANTVITGLSGAGKSSLLEYFIHEAATRGLSNIVFDPNGHRQFVDGVRNAIVAGATPERPKTYDDVIVVDINDPNCPTINLIEIFPSDNAASVAQRFARVGLAFDIWTKKDSQHYEIMAGDYLTFIFHFLIVGGNKTVVTPKHIYMFSRVKEFRKRVIQDYIARTSDRDFPKQFARFSHARDFEEASTNFINLLEQTFLNPSVGHIFNNELPDISLQKIISEGKSVIFSSQADLVPDTYKALARMTVANIHGLMSSRARLKTKPAPVFVTLDEFYKYSTPEFLDALARIRKSQMPVVMAMQTFSQLANVHPGRRTEELTTELLNFASTFIATQHNTMHEAEILAALSGTKTIVEETEKVHNHLVMNPVESWMRREREVTVYHPNSFLKHPKGVVWIRTRNKRGELIQEWVTTPWPSFSDLHFDPTRLAVSAPPTTAVPAPPQASIVGTIKDKVKKMLLKPIEALRS